MKSLKKISYLLISIALLFTALSLVRFHDTSEPETVRTWGIAEVVSLETVNYETTVSDTGLSCTPNAEKAYLKLPLNGECFNLVYLNFAEPIPDMGSSFLYYTTDGSYDQSAGYAPHYSTDEKQMIFCIPNVEGGVEALFYLDGAFTLQSISVLQLSDAPLPLTWSFRATAVLAVMLLALILAERKLGYFAYLRARVVGEISYVRALFANGKRAKLILHLANLLVTAFLAAAVCVFVLIGHYTNVSILCVFAGTVLVIALQLLDRIASGRGAEPAKLFLAVTLLLGMMMCYSMPPSMYVSWDDETHFRRSYDLVHFLDGENSLSERRVISYRTFPVNSYADDPQSFVYSVIDGSAISVRTDAYMSNPYSAVSYLPMMLTQLLLWLTGADAVTLILLCRFANLLAYAFFIYFGIRKLKNGAWIFAAVCMIPTAFFLACSCNYDFWLTAWFVYAFSTLISVLQSPDRKFAVSDMVKILVAFLLGCAPKAIYCFMMLPLLFLKKEKFESPKHAKRFRMWTLITLGFILATVVVPGLVVPDLYTDTRGGSDVSSGGQIQFILSHPFAYARILLKFLGEYCSLVQMNGSSAFFAYLGNSLSFFGTVAAFMLLYCVFTDRREGDGYELMQPNRWLTLATCFVQLVLIVTSLYVGFTPVGHETVNGCQYRYIIPLLVPFCYFMAPKGIKCSIDPKFQNAFVFGALAFNVAFSFFNAYLVTML